MIRPLPKLPRRQQAGLARSVFALHERGWSLRMIERALGLSRSDAVNLIGYGRRLAAGQGQPLQWEEGA